MTQKPLAPSGWIACDKPSGMGCVGVARSLKRMFCQKRIGHLGTLDPLASGVLTLALGEATKLIPYLQHTSKVYEFTIRWGEARDTDDATGRMTATSDIVPSDEAIYGVLALFVGRIKQIPPLYSAIHINGTRAYQLARQGKVCDMPEREVDIYQLDYLAEGRQFRVTCGSGTYVRSLARDMAHALGTVGHITSLRRTHDGLFSIHENLWPYQPTVRAHLYAPETLIQHLPCVHLDDDQIRVFRQGGFVKGNPAYLGWIATYHNEQLCGISTWKDGCLRPHRVLLHEA